MKCYSLSKVLIDYCRNGSRKYGPKGVPITLPDLVSVIKVCVPSLCIFLLDLLVICLPFHNNNKKNQKEKFYLTPKAYRDWKYLPSKTDNNRKNKK